MRGAGRGYMLQGERGEKATMRDDEWILDGPHQFVDCWCGHAEELGPNEKTLDLKYDRVHRWINVGCPPGCDLQARVHGHVHVHCPECAKVHTPRSCCTPPRS